jgi:hypothetical protein
MESPYMMQRLPADREENWRSWKVVVGCQLSVVSERARDILPLNEQADPSSAARIRNDNFWCERRLIDAREPEIPRPAMAGSG